MTLPVLDVAVAVLKRLDGRVLLGERPPGKPWAGWWEFPGGKIERAESPLQALRRELREELGIDAVEATPWLTRTFSYPEKTVNLHFFTVRAWQGEPRGREGQALAWQHPDRLEVAPLLPANETVIKMLKLPEIYAVTNLAEAGPHEFASQLDRALDAGLRLVQVREKRLDPMQLEAFARTVVARCRPRGARVLINADVEMARAVAADGVHLTSAQLMQLEQKPDFAWLGASCHDRRQLHRARELGVDFVTLSPVKPTRSHPEASPLGWPAFAAMLEHYPLPVFALGGMQPADLATAWRHGAHGIAMQRGAWPA